MALIATMIALSVFVARLLHFSGDIVSRLVRRHPESWLARLRYIWYPLAVCVPLVLALLAAMGYYYSALAVDARLGSTIYLVLGLIMINDLLLRWLYVSRRRLAWEKAKRKQAARREKYEKQHPGKTSLKTETAPIEELEIKISQIDEQNRTLLRTIMLFAALIGLWAIWAQILPALNFMQKVQLWTYRVGDIVTIGEVSGRVSRIRIRATTIVDWDRRELIVPKKDFITGQLINWSLSDKVTRLIVPVGIAYGSDTAPADKLLLKIAADHPHVLDEPGSAAYFLGFGDNSLNFELRAFIDEPLNRVQVISDLHRAIDDAFREANIEISFPRRDVHLDQSGPLEVRVLQEQGLKNNSEPRAS
ncbi:MAG: mechanosensitive ion channel [bacterium]|nr:mechanosensitive ion channel [bacterium]